MTESEALARLRHDLSNPLAAMLVEIQLLLMDPDHLPNDVIEALKTIEGQALRMRTLLRE